MDKKSKTLLVFCTGNYYRSRFVEKYFNELAGKIGLNWSAFSRGIALWEGILNEGPMSVYTIDYLNTLGIPYQSNDRLPLQMVEADLTVADLILGIDEPKHKPLLAEQFPDWVDKDHVIFWNVPDIDQVTPSIALNELRERVEQLVESLSRD